MNRQEPLQGYGNIFAGAQVGINSIQLLLAVRTDGNGYRHILPVFARLESKSAFTKVIDMPIDDFNYGCFKLLTTQTHRLDRKITGKRQQRLTFRQTQIMHTDLFFITHNSLPECYYSFLLPSHQ